VFHLAQEATEAGAAHLLMFWLYSCALSGAPVVVDASAVDAPVACSLRSTDLGPARVAGQRCRLPVVMVGDRGSAPGDGCEHCVVALLLILKAMVSILQHNISLQMNEQSKEVCPIVRVHRALPGIIKS
jgi:hypothetical protein